LLLLLLLSYLLAFLLTRAGPGVVRIDPLHFLASYCIHVLFCFLVFGCQYQCSR